MAISREEVERVAELARLEIPEAGIERMRAELSEVLEFVQVLRRLDLEGCAPTTFAPEDAPLREDTPDDRRLGCERATAAAPEGEGGFFLVPPIVDYLEP